MRRMEPGSSTFGTDGSSGTEPTPSNRTRHHLRFAADGVAYRIGENRTKGRCRQHERAGRTLFNHKAKQRACNGPDSKRRERFDHSSEETPRAPMVFRQRPETPWTRGHIAHRIYRLKE